MSTTLDRHAPPATAPVREPTGPTGARTTTAIRTEGVAPGPVARVAVWDNARLIVIVLVVFGHLIESMRGTPVIDALYALVYAFHMPALLLISGVFASSDRLSPKRLAGTAQLLVVWLLVEFGWAAERALTGHAAFPTTFLVMPEWAAWFLLSLFTMRMLLPYVALLPHPLILTSLLGLAAGLVPTIGQEFSASRSLALLPFFVLGWSIRRYGVDRRAWFLTPSLATRIAAGLALVVAAGAVLALMTLPHFNGDLLTWRRSYGAMRYTPVQGLALRAAMMAIAAAMTCGLLLLVPRRARWFTRLGENTLYVYLLHIPAVLAIRVWHLDARILHLPLTPVVALAAAVAITLVLAQPVVKRLTGWALEPRWLFRRALERRPA